MDANEYQTLAGRTLLGAPPRVYTGNEIMLVWNALGLAGESGEVADDIKKGIFHDHGIDRVRLAKELGDVQWYVAAIATSLNLQLGDDIMDANIKKLIERYPTGFNAADSINRSGS